MARLARADLVDPAEIAAFHCIQRCVRQCFLCGRDPLTGRDFEHRKAWLEERLRFLAGQFGIDLLAFAILSNHFHVVLRSRPDVVAAWTDDEIARRWLALCPLRREADGSPAEPSDAELAAIAHRPERLAALRRRLSDISWLMRMIAEPIARRANGEEGVAGRFWSGRFRSVKLCDEAAILACCAYVDLNVVRAGLAATPEESDFTSIQRRIEGRTGQDRSALAGEPPPSEREPDDWLAPIPLEEAAAAGRTALPGESAPADDASSVAASGKQKSQRRSQFAARNRCSDKGFLSLTLDEYLELVDWTGRQVRPNKRGAIPATAPPILARLGIATPDWLSLAVGFGELFARVAGRRGSSPAAHRTGRRFHPGHARLLGGT